VNESLPFLSSHLRIGIAEDKTDRGEEVALAGAIATDNYIEFGRERVDDRLVLVAGLPVS
jgi:hypothetical protein